MEKTFRVTPENNRFVLNGKFIPKARLGTLSITDIDNSIKSIKSYVDTLRTPNLIRKVSTSSYVDMLKANLNKVITITTDKKIRKGEVKEIMYHSYNNASHILLKEGAEYNIIRIQDIISLSFPSKPTIPISEIIQPDPFSNRKVGDLKLNVVLEFNNSSPKEISMKYLQKGISWMPFYYLEIDDTRKNAKLTLKAELVNDSEDIINTNLDLFIGEPNFEYSNYLTDLIDFKNLLNPDYDADSGNSNNLNYLSVSAYSISRDKNQYNQSQNKPKNYQDFYIYKISNENLKKNSRAHYQLFETELEYKHVYECDLLNINHQINSQKKEDNTVYHSLKFVNTTKNLLGEGPVTIIDNVTAP
ncbi:MAG: hypothetical protein GY936_07230 [Ignavibacteriae bacterium]|nr:hypothetical protein [Ignavibacteriota bacterium]